MERSAESLALMACVSLRCALPLVVTLLLARLLSWLDARWARQARIATLEMGTTIGHEIASEQSILRQPPCWQVQGCSAGRREYCQAYYQPERPCWQIFSQNGTVRHQCQACQVYQQAQEVLALA